MKNINDLIKEFELLGNQVKIIFLDVDGVLNHEEYYKRGAAQDVFGQNYCPDTIANLNRIVNECGGPDKVKIVMSSSHRHGSATVLDTGGQLKEIIGLEYVQGLWKYRELPSDVIDITPYYFVEKGPNKRMDSIIKTPEKSIPRGYEIKQWLNAVNFYHEYFSFLNDRSTVVQNYVIIDDDPDMLYEQRNNFVQTSPRKGLDKKTADKAIKILNKKYEKRIKRTTIRICESVSK